MYFLNDDMKNLRITGIPDRKQMGTFSLVQIFPEIVKLIRFQ